MSKKHLIRAADDRSTGTDESMLCSSITAKSREHNSWEPIRAYLTQVSKNSVWSPDDHLRKCNESTLHNCQLLHHCQMLHHCQNALTQALRIHTYFTQSRLTWILCAFRLRKWGNDTLITRRSFVEVQREHKYCIGSAFFGLFGHGSPCKLKYRAAGTGRLAIAFQTAGKKNDGTEKLNCRDWKMNHFKQRKRTIDETGIPSCWDWQLFFKEWKQATDGTEIPSC